MDASPSDCPLERWRERARIDGSAAKEKLRLGVEAALIELGAGFLENPANADLRDALITGKLTRQAYYEELLRLVYRLIFLFAAEDRGLLHTPNAPDATRKAYRQGYAVGRLRERCTRNTSLDRHHGLGRPAGAFRRPCQGRDASRAGGARRALHPLEPRRLDPVPHRQRPPAQGHLASLLVPARRTAHDPRELARHANRGTRIGLRKLARTHPRRAYGDPQLRVRRG